MNIQDYESLMNDCPHCGSHAKIVREIDWDSFVVSYYPECSKCKLTTRETFSTEILAVSAWDELNKQYTRRKQ